MTLPLFPQKELSMQKKTIFFILILLSLLFAACGGQPPLTVEIDGETVTSQERVHLTVAVGGDPNSLVYQQAAAHGSYTQFSSGYGSGSFVGQVIDGKTILRVLIVDMEENIPTVDVNESYIIKMVDGKGVGLIQGDVIYVSCVVDVEFVGVHTGSISTMGTNQDTRERIIEIDDCRWNGRLLSHIDSFDFSTEGD